VAGVTEVVLASLVQEVDVNSLLLGDFVADLVVVQVGNIARPAVLRRISLLRRSLVLRVSNRVMVELLIRT